MDTAYTESARIGATEPLRLNGLGIRHSEKDAHFRIAGQFELPLNGQWLVVPGYGLEAAHLDHLIGFARWMEQAHRCVDADQEMLRRLAMGRAERYGPGGVGAAQHGGILCARRSLGNAPERHGGGAISDHAPLQCPPAAPTLNHFRPEVRHMMLSEMTHGDPMPHFCSGRLCRGNRQADDLAS